MNKQRITFQNVHHTREFNKRFISSLSEDIQRAVICSPYFDSLPKPFDDVLGFCRFLKRRGTDDIQIITRPPGSDKQSLPLSTARMLSSLEVEIHIRTKPYLHAKLYHLQYRKGHFRSFVGSANFTLGGFERNHELVAELEGVGDNSACHREIQRMQSLNGAVPFETWIARGQPRGVAEEK